MLRLCTHLVPWTYRNLAVSLTEQLCLSAFLASQCCDGVTHLSHSDIHLVESCLFLSHVWVVDSAWTFSHLTCFPSVSFLSAACSLSEVHFYLPSWCIVIDLLACRLPVVLSGQPALQPSLCHTTLGAMKTDCWQCDRLGRQRFFCA